MASFRANTWQQCDSSALTLKKSIMSSATYKTCFSLKWFNILKFESVTGRVSTTGRVTQHFYVHKKVEKEYRQISQLPRLASHVATFFKANLATFSQVGQHLGTFDNKLLIKLLIQTINQSINQRTVIEIYRDFFHREYIVAIFRFDWHFCEPNFI